MKKEKEGCFMLTEIEKYDKNLVVETDIKEPDIVWFSARELPFSFFGVMYDEEMGCYTRMPQRVATGISAGVSGSLNRCTAGGRVRFRTDSSYIAIRAVMKSGGCMSHMPLTGQSGFDLYRVERNGRDTYYRTFVPPRNMTDGYSSGIYTDRVMTDYTINFPLYDGVKELYVALKRDAHLAISTPYRDLPPVVYYGSSITQGGCTSRPGLAYEATICRRLNRDYLNMGFSGSAKGEPRLAEYFATLPMSMFVCDYDYNAPSAEHLEATHYPFYEIIRAKNPTVPYLMISRHTAHRSENADRRREVIRASYERAKANGDENVYFLDGDSFFPDECRDSCTVDTIHPNDLGFYFMARAIGDALAKILKKQ